MPDFLFLDNVEMGEIEPETCLRIRAPDRQAAQRFLYEQEANDAEFLDYLAERSLDIGVINRFILVTEAEQEAMQDHNRVIASDAVIAERIAAFFPGRPDWAAIMQTYVCDNSIVITGAADITRLMPYEMRVFLAEHASWRSYSIINLDEVRVLA